MKKSKKEIKDNKKNNIINKPNMTKTKSQNELSKPKLDLKNNNKKIDSQSNIQSLHSQITNLKQLIEEKNKEIKELKDKNKNDSMSQNQKDSSSNDNKIEKINKKLELIKVRNDILTKNLQDKQQEIKELNNIILEYKQKITSNEQSSNLINLIKISDDDSNSKKDKHKDKYEIILNKIKNNLDESEIQNSKLVFENKVLNDKIKSLEKEKFEEIKVLESLHQKQIDNNNKTINQLNDKITELMKEIDKNKNNTINLDEYYKKNDIINDLNKKQDKIRELDTENFKLKKEMQQMINKNEELGIICKNKDLIIEKLETEIEKIDFQNGGDEKNIKQNIVNNDENKKKIELLEKENEELKLGLQNMTQGIDKANELYNEKLSYFNNQLIIKNNKLKEYKNKILILKAKVDELSNELNMIKGGHNNNNNSFFNASFINNSIINTHTIPKYNDNNINNIMLNKNNYSAINRNLNTENNVNNTNKILAMTNNYRTITNRPLQNDNINTMPNLKNAPSLNTNKDSNLIYRNGGLKTISELRENDTQEFINKNKEEDKNHINFLKEYKETLDKFQNFK